MSEGALVKAVREAGYEGEVSEGPGGSLIFPKGTVLPEAVLRVLARKSTRDSNVVAGTRKVAPPKVQAKGKTKVTEVPVVTGDKKED